LARGTRSQYDRMRLRLGVPDGSRDLVADRSLLLESGFEELHGVSFTKGCFVGQELTARTKHRGLIKRRLLPVRVDGALPAPGTQVTCGGKDAGEVRSGDGDLALALLRLDQLAAGDEPLVAGDAVLTPVPPRWLPMAALAARGR
jgi:folate-binding protein YgfZ